MEENNINNVAEIDKAVKLYETGEQYWNGTNGVPQDYEKAVEYYIEAADLGNVDAIYSLGFCYATSTGIEYDAEKAEKLLAYAADNGNLNAAVKLGNYFYWGDYLPQDYAKGYQYLKYAAEQGDANSMATVGNILLKGYGAYDGWGPARDQELGKQYIEKACELNDPYGLFLAANNYRYGYDGFPEDLTYGTKLLRKAAEAGHIYGQFQYALACFNGEGVPKDLNQYVKWVREAAGNGNDEAVIRWAFTRFTEVVPGIRCQTQQELDEVRQLLDKALADGDEFMNLDEIKAMMNELYREEERIGRKLSIGELYGVERPSNRNTGTYSINTSGRNNGGCYIATSVYGSYDCPQVWTLRRFRDYKLAETWYGRTFIRFYYAISPKLVKWFGQSKWFQRYFKELLDRFVFKLKLSGYGDEPYNDK